MRMQRDYHTKLDENKDQYGIYQTTSQVRPRGQPKLPAQSCRDLNGSMVRLPRNQMMSSHMFP